MLDSGTVWTVLFEYQSSPNDYHANYDAFVLGGDTVIGSYTYKKITGPQNTDGGLREDTVNHKVYFAGNTVLGSYNDTLIYNFDLQVGDTAYYEWGNGTWATVYAVDSVLIQSQYHKRIKLTNMGADEWVEGIGSLSMPVQPLTFEFEWNNSLMCVQRSNVTVYQFGNFPVNCPPWHSWLPPYCGLMDVNAANEQQGLSVSVVQNGNTTSLHLEGMKGNGTVSLFDVTGKELIRQENVREYCELETGSLASGIYLLRVYDETGMMVTKKLWLR
jgi:hypothetical protein